MFDSHDSISHLTWFSMTTTPHHTTPHSHDIEVHTTPTQTPIHWLIFSTLEIAFAKMKPCHCCGACHCCGDCHCHHCCVDRKTRIGFVIALWSRQMAWQTVMWPMNPQKLQRFCMRARVYVVVVLDRFVLLLLLLLAVAVALAGALALIDSRCLVVASCELGGELDTDCNWSGLIKHFNCTWFVLDLKSKLLRCTGLTQQSTRNILLSNWSGLPGPHPLPCVKFDDSMSNQEDIKELIEEVLKQNAKQLQLLAHKYHVSESENFR